MNQDLSISLILQKIWKCVVLLTKTRNIYHGVYHQCFKLDMNMWFHCRYVYCSMCTYRKVLKLMWKVINYIRNAVDILLMAYKKLWKLVKITSQADKLQFWYLYSELQKDQHFITSRKLRTGRNVTNHCTQIDCLHRHHYCKNQYHQHYWQNCNQKWERVMHSRIWRYSSVIFMLM